MAAALIVAIATACSEDGADTSVLDCSLLAKDRPYRYRSVATFDLAERPPGAPPEQVQDYGPEPFKFSREFDGILQAADRLEAVIHQENSVDLTIRVVGNQAWTRVLDDPTGALGDWQLTPIETAGELFPLERICALVAPDVSLGDAAGKADTVNGVAALQYSFRSIPSQLPASIYGPESDFARFIPALDLDVWLAKANRHPIRLAIQGTGHYENERALTLSISSEITEVKDDSVKIAPP